MKATRQNPAEWEESASLLPQPERDLPAGRHQFHKERLMAHIQQDESTTVVSPARPKIRRARLLRPAFTLPAMALTLAGAVAVGSVLIDGDGGSAGVATGPALTTSLGSSTTEGVPQLLDQISLAAAESTHPVVKPGQYVYIASKTANTFVKTVDGKSGLASHVLHQRQIWESPDGTKGWLVDPAVNSSPEGETLSLPDEQGNTPKAHLGSPSYDYLSKLTTDPDALLAKIYKETKGQGNSLTSRRSPRSGTWSWRAMRPRSSTRLCSRRRRRSLAWSWSTMLGMQSAGAGLRWHGWMRPAVHARNGSSTRRAMHSSVCAPCR